LDSQPKPTVGVTIGFRIEFLARPEGEVFIVIRRRPITQPKTLISKPIAGKLPFLGCLSGFCDQFQAFFVSAVVSDEPQRSHSSGLLSFEGYLDMPGKIFYVFYRCCFRLARVDYGA